MPQFLGNSQKLYPKHCGAQYRDPEVPLQSSYNASAFRALGFRVLRLRWHLRTPTMGFSLGTYNRNRRESQRLKGLSSKLSARKITMLGRT